MFLLAAYAWPLAISAAASTAGTAGWDVPALSPEARVEPAPPGAALFAACCAAVLFPACCAAAFCCAARFAAAASSASRRSSCACAIASCWLVSSICASSSASWVLYLASSSCTVVSTAASRTSFSLTGVAVVILRAVVSIVTTRLLGTLSRGSHALPQTATAVTASSSQAMRTG